MSSDQACRRRETGRANTGGNHGRCSSLRTAGPIRSSLASVGARSTSGRPGVLWRSRWRCRSSSRAVRRCVARCSWGHLRPTAGPEHALGLEPVVLPSPMRRGGRHAPRTDVIPVLEGLSYRPFHGPTKSTSPSRPNLATLVRRPAAAQRSIRSSTASASRLCCHWPRPRHRGLRAARPGPAWPGSARPRPRCRLGRRPLTGPPTANSSGTPGACAHMAF